MLVVYTTLGCTSVLIIEYVKAKGKGKGRKTYEPSFEFGLIETKVIFRRVVSSHCSFVRSHCVCRIHDPGMCVSSDHRIRESEGGGQGEGDLQAVFVIYFYHTL